MVDFKVSIDDLPMRPKRLSEDELGEIFGGCTKKEKNCSKNKDCCDGLKCVKAGFFEVSGTTTWSYSSSGRCKNPSSDALKEW